MSELINACAGYPKSKGGFNIPEFKLALKLKFKEYGVNKDNIIDAAKFRNQLHILCDELKLLMKSSTTSATASATASTASASATMPLKVPKREERIKMENKPKQIKNITKIDNIIFCEINYNENDGMENLLQKYLDDNFQDYDIII